MTIEHEVCFE